MPNSADFQPVILGADIGIYALARALHEQYGVRSIVISGAELGPIANTSIIDRIAVPMGHDADEIVAALERVAQAHPHQRLLLLANTDWHVRVIVTHRERLERHYLVPFLSEELLTQLSDKATFAEVAERLGLSVPRTLIQDFATADQPEWQPIAVDIPFPLIAKAASSADYQEIEFPGKKKVFEIATPDELAQLWASLRSAGFTGRFVVQELIGGDDTQMRSITAYVDSHGRVTLLCAAHVLLEEHTPTALGNPAAMITYRDDAMLDQARHFLTATGYRGFANFDVKVDPATGQFKFLEVNPRIGRNNFYVTAAGANPMRFLVEDVIYGREVDPVVVDAEILYSILPLGLLTRYIRDPRLRERVRRLHREGREFHPLAYPADMNLKRRWYIALARFNQRRKFKRHYPVPTQSGF